MPVMRLGIGIGKNNIVFDSIGFVGDLPVGRRPSYGTLFSAKRVLDIQNSAEALEIPRSRDEFLTGVGLDREIYARC